MEYEMQRIGTIHSPYKTKESCPFQGMMAPEGEAEIEVFPEYEEAMETIEHFTHIILFYIFDRAGEEKLSGPTFLDKELHGVFASRHPSRPNHMGFTVVRLLKRDKNRLWVSGIDTLDNTPLIDIKPYVPKFDVREDANNGWLDRFLGDPARDDG